jgi:hypothetical protein
VGELVAMQHHVDPQLPSAIMPDANAALITERGPTGEAMTYVVFKKVLHRIPAKLEGNSKRWISPCIPDRKTLRVRFSNASRKRKNAFSKFWNLCCQRTSFISVDDNGSKAPTISFDWRVTLTCAVFQLSLFIHEGVLLTTAIDYAQRKSPPRPRLGKRR